MADAARAARCSPPRHNQRSSRAQAATRSTPSSSRAVRRGAGSAEEQDLPLPETVQGIIAARLDALPADEKTLAPACRGDRQGVLAGRAGALGAERCAARAALHALERKAVRAPGAALVGRRPRPSTPSATLLVRDVAYGQIPRAERAESHRRAAEWIEALAERSDDFAEMLAHHYAVGARARDRVGRRRRRPSGSCPSCLAPRRPTGLLARRLPAAPSFYSAALELWPGDDPELPDLQLGAGQLPVGRGAARRPPARGAGGLLAQGRRAAPPKRRCHLGFLWWNEGRGDLARLTSARSSDCSPAPKRRGRARLPMRRSPSGRWSPDGRRRESSAPAAALELAEQLSLDDVRAHALLTIGTMQVRAWRQGLAGRHGGESRAQRAAQLGAGSITACKNIGDCFVATASWSVASSSRRVVSQPPCGSATRSTSAGSALNGRRVLPDRSLGRGARAGRRDHRRGGERYATLSGELVPQCAHAGAAGSRRRSRGARRQRARARVRRPRPADPPAHARRTARACWWSWDDRRGGVAARRGDSDRLEGRARAGQTSRSPPRTSGTRPAASW